MDVVCSFGRSVDVDGDEWIDLGLPPTPRGGEDDGTELLSLTPGEMRTADIDDKNPFAAAGETSNKPVAAAVSTPQPLPEPEPANKTQRKPIATKLARDPNIESIPERKKPSPAPPAPVVKSKAARSKELFMLLTRKRLLLQLYELSYSVKLLGSIALLNPLHSYLAFEGLGERPTQDPGAQGFRHLLALM
ncbi:hypothetical protein PHYSODRAFT_336686 [Phytophthora sojae]|uniref:Uncharacterized protein n=1 Tax=Phytophthora sojae (strain P6497) TaxID=1094619 RepID=G4ZVK6_PHYSP|nr:hypothetical protein PHYSODRAFT_336686 [Phytophthora sojae]EGZ12245.1 hypothetical protein PHYSODRAFT_336686 [Phytophthora sojae]|eukprot:XP_009532578.1 hypothetical protein PHYSODRAFT_336686 [Phytophthora sojae]